MVWPSTPVQVHCTTKWKPRENMKAEENVEQVCHDQLRIPFNRVKMEVSEIFRQILACWRSKWHLINAVPCVPWSRKWYSLCWSSVQTHAHAVWRQCKIMQVIPDGPTCKNMKLLPHKYPVRRWLSHRWTLPWRSLLDSKRKLRSQNSPAGILKKVTPNK